MTDHRFQLGDCIKAKSSGKFYRVVQLRDDPHRKLKGELGYSVIGFRNGEPFGATRLMPESSFEITIYGERAS